MKRFRFGLIVAGLVLGLLVAGPAAAERMTTSLVLPPFQQQTVNMPEGAEALTVLLVTIPNTGGYQIPKLTAEVDPENEDRIYYLYTVKDGSVLPPDAQTWVGGYVWQGQIYHVYLGSVKPILNLNKSAP